MSAVAGQDCKLYYDSASNVASPTWVLITKAKDVSVPSTADAADASARYSRYKKYVAGLVDESIQFGYQYSTDSDTIWDALKGAYVAGTSLQMAVADGAIATNGTTYHKDWYIFTEFSSEENLDGSKTFQVTAQPTPKFSSGSLVDKTYTTV